MIPSCVRTPAILGAGGAPSRSCSRPTRAGVTASGSPKQEGFSAALLRQVRDDGSHRGVGADGPPCFCAPWCRFAGFPAPDYDDEQWDRVRGVTLVLVLAAAQLEHVFSRPGDGGLPRRVPWRRCAPLGTAAAPTDLNLRLDYQLRHILVDEFQDTSSAQLELVKLLTAGMGSADDGRSVFFASATPCSRFTDFARRRCGRSWSSPKKGSETCASRRCACEAIFAPPKPLVDWINVCFFGHLAARPTIGIGGAIAFRPSESAMGAGGAGQHRRYF